MLLSPFWRYFEATRTVYAITNKRAFTLGMANRIEVRNYFPNSIGNFKKIVKSDGVGDLILGFEHYKDAEGDKQIKEYGFFAVNKINEVEKLIENLIEINT